MSNTAGVLYVVATPIGNLADITQRALSVLSEVTLIAAEDTRRTRHLLTHFGIAGRLTALHEHNEGAASAGLIAHLEGGDDIALVSDAGTPLISDPGFLLVQEARNRGIRVMPIPGANAALAALAASGLPCDRFLFLGFPPRTSAKRLAWIATAAHERGTLILYEAGNRVPATLRDLVAVLGGARRGVLAREITKRFETFLGGTLEDLVRRLDADAEQRQGEFVVLIEGEREGGCAEDLGAEERVLRVLAAELPLKQAVSLAAQLTGGKKNRLYQLALRWQGRAEAEHPM